MSDLSTNSESPALGKDALLNEIRSQADHFVALVNDLPAEAWEGGDVAQWGSAHHLAHLISSHKRTAQGFAARDRLPCYEQDSRSYDEVKDAYTNALAAIPAERLQPNPIPPEVPQGWTRAEALAAFRGSLEALNTSLTPWSESDLDALALPHPLLGPISARELLHFTAYHLEHHQAGIKRSGERLTS